MIATSAAAQPANVARARALDRQGQRALKEGRYNDAIRLFRESLKQGGPPHELWNIAKCHLQLDQPEAAAEALERYLAAPRVRPQDRKRATAQLNELRSRRSQLAVASTPQGAAVYLDGNRTEPLGTTPFKSELAPGTHKLSIESTGYKPYVRDVVASYGREVNVEVQLEHGPAGDVAPARAREETSQGAIARAMRRHRARMGARMGAKMGARMAGPGRSAAGSPWERPPRSSFRGWAASTRRDGWRACSAPPTPWPRRLRRFYRSGSGWC
jgi:hypothetical protein